MTLGAWAGVPSTAERSTPAVSTVAVQPTSYASTCEGMGGVANNLVGGLVGSLAPAILQEPELGTPYLDGDVVRVDSSVAFASWGSCSSQVAFQMQTKVCGFWGCNWETRNHGTWEFLWKHDDTGQVAQQVTMGCRPGTNSYRVHMAVVGLASTAEEGSNGRPGAIGVETDNDEADGPVIKLTC